MLKPCAIVLVGQIYLDTILHVPHFPHEDHKLRASSKESRRGGNGANTAEVLAQYLSNGTVYLMSALSSQDKESPWLKELQAMGINTSLCVFRDNATTPSSYIIHSEQSGTRTIISHTTIQDITLEEFQKFCSPVFADSETPLWFHFEGRNIDQVLRQINWLRSASLSPDLTISVECEKPDRPSINSLIAEGDLVFFSKLFAERRGYDHPTAFLQAVQSQCRRNSYPICTWGEEGAFALDPENGVIHAEADNVDHLIDSVGAGDTFIAGVILGLLQPCRNKKQALAVALRLGCQLASTKVAQTGFQGLANNCSITLTK